MESLSDIERDLRDRADCAERHGDRETHNDGVATLLRSIADRIKAIDSADAWRSLYTPGNAAAMREALVAIRDALCEHPYDHDDDALANIANAALSAPTRQCDVGTAEEQVARHHAYCYHMMKRNNHCCGPCPCYKFVNGEAQSCTLLWAQLPYDAKEGAVE